MQNLHLVVIDPQMSFCTPPGTYTGITTGELFVPGADEDMKRLEKLVRRLTPKLSDIHITLDSHHAIDVAHPAFWKDSKGKHPNPFTTITDSDVRNGVWTPTVLQYPNPTPGGKPLSMVDRMITYTETLAGKRGTPKRYNLMVWPPHCLIGSPGQTIVPDLFAAINNWAETRHGTIDFVTKGSNIYTEHYSAVRAEVPDPNDPTTQLNTSLIETIEQSDIVLWAGEASSHCLLNTFVDVVNNFGSDAIKKMVLLTDATSAVTGCQSMYDDFLKEYTGKGMRTATTVDFLT